MNKTIQSVADGRRHYRSAWPREQRDFLMRHQLIEFVPLADGESTPDWKLGEPPEIASRRSLAERQQHFCFLQWVRVHEDLWSNPTWRGCTAMRHGEGDVVAFKLMPESWRKRLDARAKKLRKEFAGNDVPEDAMRNGMIDACPVDLPGSAFWNLGYEYFRARLGGTYGPDHALRRPVSQCGLFERIFDATNRRNPVGGPIFPDREMFLRYLTAPEGHYYLLVGEVLLALMRLESWAAAKPDNLDELSDEQWPDFLAHSQLAPNDDFNSLQQIYMDKLGLPRDLFRSIWAAYLTLRIKDLQPRRSHVHHTVFWADKFVELLRPDAHEAYRAWARLFRTRVLTPFLNRGQGLRDRIEFRSIFGVFKESLLHDPLLNAVFHTDVLGGQSFLKPQKERGRPRMMVEGTLIAYAARQWKLAMRSGTRQRVEEILSDPSIFGRQVRNALEVHDTHGSSVIAFLSPLLTAVLGQGRMFYTPVMIKEAIKRYDRSPEVDALSSNLAHRFDEVQGGLMV